MPDKSMQIWTKYKPKIRLKPHSLLPGLCAMWLNEAIDYGMSQNKWPVRFRDADGVLVDLVPEFLTAVWAKYASMMVRTATMYSTHARIHAIHHVYDMHLYAQICTSTNTHNITPNTHTHTRARIHAIHHIYDIHIYV